MLPSKPIRIGFALTFSALIFLSLCCSTGTSARIVSWSSDDGRGGSAGADGEEERRRKEEAAAAAAAIGDADAGNDSDDDDDDDNDDHDKARRRRRATSETAEMPISTWFVPSPALNKGAGLVQVGRVRASRPICQKARAQGRRMYQ